MPTSELRNLLGDKAALADERIAELTADRSRLPVVFPGLARRFGREPIGGGRRTIGDATVDLDAYRRCDLAAALLVTSIDATADEVTDVFLHGDVEERTMTLRALNFLPLGQVTASLLGEVLRTNVVLHMEAALCDSNLLARAHAGGAVDTDTKNRLVLKFAFVDLPFARVLDGDALASVELSTMLQDLATEREAAGRAVWRDTWRMAGLAPCPGATARLLGGIEHGDDGVREAACEGLLRLRDTSDRELIARLAGERLNREPRASIKTLLQRLSD